MCRHCVCAASPIIHASRSSYLGFFEPVMRIWLVVERLDFDISALAIQRLRFCEGPIGLEPQGAQAKFPCNNFQGFEHAPTDAESTRIGRDPHALYFADISIFHFERAATDRLTAEAGDDEDARRRCQFIGIRGDALCRVESGFEAAGELAKIFFETPTRIEAVRRFCLYLNGRRAHQSLDLRHRRDQAIPLRPVSGAKTDFANASERRSSSVSSRRPLRVNVTRRTRPSLAVGRACTSP